MGAPEITRNIAGRRMRLWRSPAQVRRPAPRNACRGGAESDSGQHGDSSTEQGRPRGPRADSSITSPVHDPTAMPTLRLDTLSAMANVFVGAAIWPAVAIRIG